MEKEPIIVNGILLNPTTPFEKMKGCRKKVERFKRLGKHYKKGGTLLISNAQVVRMKEGYQVSFMRPEDEIRFTDEEYDEICNWIMKKTESRLFAGFWPKKKPNDPGVEPSFWYYDLNVMLEIARVFNQESVLDWEAVNNGCDKIYIKNKFYDEKSPKLDKEAILKKIREDK